MAQANPTTAYVERLFGAALGSLDLLGLYLGDQLGYYRALAAAKGGLTSKQLASNSGTNERYAREWLEQQAASEMIAVVSPSDHGQKRRYGLLPGTAEVLIDPESLNYFAPMAQMLIGTTRQATGLLNAYRTGSGVPWSKFGRDMREAQAAFNRPMFMNLLAREYLPSVKDVHQLLSRAGGSRVADIACGGGWSSIAIALGYPGARVDGYDLDGPSIVMARKNARASGVADRVKFHHRDAGDSKLAGKYDLVTVFEAVHDMPQPVPVLKTMRRLAGKDGVVLVMDERVGEKFSAPAGPIERFMYGASIGICLPDGMAHKPTAATGTVMRPPVLRKYAADAGFKSVDVLPIENDFFRFYRLRQ